MPMTTGAGKRGALCANPACGKAFTPGKAASLYCSRKCSNAARAARTRERRRGGAGDPRAACAVCGAMFTPRAGRWRYCSPECGDGAKRKSGARGGMPAGAAACWALSFDPFAVPGMLHDWDGRLPDAAMGF